MFKKILIANRGEIALRVIRTCKEMGIKTVAVYSTADKESLHVRFADEAVCIGPPPSSQSYLNIPNIISAAEITNADAIHPGYGFLSENADFSRICYENGIKFIGASPAMIDAMGDKASAKATMKKAGVPTIPGSEGLLKNMAEGIKLASKVKYPIILKATAGGGGKGMRIVKNETEFEKAWNDAKNEAKASFGNDGLYLEKFVEEPRHIEIQIVGDQEGKSCHLSERDCSIQRRHQKLIEETPSPFISDELRDRMGEAAIAGANAISYEGVGTIEFLVDKNKDFYFMEMNTRIQVEHPVTEEVIDYDLIKEQIKVAAGIKISGKNYYPKKHSMECRINAEDPLNGFRPSPGKITVLHIPGGHGVRVDTHVYAGYVIPPTAAQQPAAAPADSALSAAPAPADETKLVTIKSPMIGTFYRSSSPDKPLFVNVGDEVKKGQVICIIEAMKLFNEIESEISGRIVKVLVENASPVEYDHPLFLVEPSE